MKKILMAMVLAIGLVAVSTAAHAVAYLEHPASDYFPLENGGAWTYTGPDGSFSASSYLVISPDYTTTATTAMQFAGGSTDIEFYTNNGNGVELHGRVMELGGGVYQPVYFQSPLSVLPPALVTGSYTSTTECVLPGVGTMTIDVTTEVQDVLSSYIPYPGAPTFYNVIPVEIIIHHYGIGGDADGYEKRSFLLKEGVGVIGLQIYESEDADFTADEMTTCGYVTDYTAYSFDSGSVRIAYTPSIEDAVYTYYDDDSEDGYGRLYSIVGCDADGAYAEYNCLFANDTDAVLMKYESDIFEDIGGTSYAYYTDPKAMPVGVRMELDWNEWVSAIEYRPVDDERGMVTKVEYTDGSTAWFLWEAAGDYPAGTVICWNASASQLYSYVFTPDLNDEEACINPDNWRMEEPIDYFEEDLPELGNWYDWCDTNGIVGTFAPLNSVAWSYNDDGLLTGRYYSGVYEPAFDYDIMTSYAISWDDSSGTLLATVTLYNDWYEDDIYQWVYDTNGSYDIDTFDTWRIYIEANLWAETDTYYMYDKMGRVYQKYFSDGTFVTITYDYEGSGDRFEIRQHFDGVQNIDIESFRYYGNSDRVRYHWTAADYLEDGEAAFEVYDESGRIVEAYYDGYHMYVSYDLVTGLTYFEQFEDDAHSVFETKEYFADGTILRYHYVADQNPDEDGDAVFTEYDNFTRVVKVTYDDGYAVVYDYASEWSKALRMESFYDGETLYETKEYWKDGTSLRYHWMLDTDGVADGDVTFEEYDMDGVTLLKQEFDDGAKTIRQYDGYVLWREIVYGAGNVWQKTTQYYDWGSGLAVEYEWLKDQNLDATGDIFENRYNNGKLIKVTYDDRSNERYSYWDGTGPLYRVALYDASNVWQRTEQYHSDGTTLNWEWFRDDPGVSGEVKENRYDAAGRLVKVTYDSGANVRTSYWGTTSVPYEVAEYDAANIWQKTSRFLADGTIQYEWFRDNAGVGGEVKENRYDALGRLTVTKYDDGSNVRQSYWGTTTALYQVARYDAANAWYETLQYRSDGSKERQWLKTVESNDIRERRFDTFNRVTMFTLADNSNVRFTYWGETDDTRNVSYYDAANVWSHTDGYRSDGETLQYEWIAVGVDANDVYREYDGQGNCIKRKLWNQDESTGALSFRYEYGDGYKVRERMYINNNYTDLFEVDTYFMNETNRRASFTRIDSGVQMTNTFVDNEYSWYDEVIGANSFSGDTVYGNYLANDMGRYAFEVRNAFSPSGDELAYMYSYYSTGELHYSYAFEDQLFETFLRIHEYNTSGDEINTYTTIQDPVAGDVSEFDQFLEVQSKLQSYGKTAEGGFIYTPGMAGVTEPLVEKMAV